MGFNLKEKRIEKMLKDERMFKGYCARGKTLIGLPGKEQPKYFDLLSIINQNYPIEIKQALERISHVNETLVSRVISDIPNSLMSEVHKEWVLTLLIYRKEWLLDWYERRL